MPEDEALSRLRALDAVAAEADAVLGFRVCEPSEALEPVFLRFFEANAGAANEAALLSIEDQDGLSLGRYVIGRRRFDEALARAEDVEAEAEPTVVPADWRGG